MNSAYLTEAFKELNMLNEEAFDVDEEGVADFKELISSRLQTVCPAAGMPRWPSPVPPHQSRATEHRCSKTRNTRTATAGNCSAATHRWDE